MLIEKQGSATEGVKLGLRCAVRVIEWLFFSLEAEKIEEATENEIGILDQHNHDFSLDTQYHSHQAMSRRRRRYILPRPTPPRWLPIKSLKPTPGA